MIDFYVNLAPGVKSSLIITTVLIIALSLIGLRVKKLQATDVPHGITLIAVMFVEMVNDMVKNVFHKNWKPYAPLTMTILIFLLFANTVSLFGLTAPLSNIMVALSFSVFAFGSIQLVGYTVTNPFKRAKSMLNPLNLIGEISTPLAMGLRLFGNLLSGSIIGLIIFRGSYELAMFIFDAIDILILNGIGFAIFQTIGLGVGAFIHAVFDVFFGAIQAYVYFMLFTIFMSLAVEE
ncbi:F0F1 ATP synthase subunit A [Candidatus Xianfuyuplasma coldseepsis]|uniref:F0F1 ATP synthase subunit A n=1 Tax=Candidatus Xianfuyuplasma coldseepsis TaxID=2782163 RepID=A0A7L7KT17_9MOLU|nr:F0F1 ATP synthase subunit A [Xianfuyuplasma coldseepsis]QMS85422.1 F0F1 ATP synthase subunit A [Xianfuyuplasma coldseepsis]